MFEYPYGAINNPFPQPYYAMQFGEDPQKKVVSNLNRGYQVCNAKNRAGKPCQRIGVCPFHFTKTPLEIVPSAWKPSQEVKFVSDNSKRKRKATAPCEEPPAHRGYLSWGPSQLNRHLQMQAEEQLRKLQPSIISTEIASTFVHPHLHQVPQCHAHSHPHQAAVDAQDNKETVQQEIKTHQKLVPKTEMFSEVQLSSPDLFEVIDMSSSKENISGSFPTFSATVFPMIDEWILDHNDSLSSPLSFSSDVSYQEAIDNSEGGKLDIDVNGTAWWTE